MYFAKNQRSANAFEVNVNTTEINTVKAGENAEYLGEEMLYSLNDTAEIKRSLALAGII